MTKAADTSAVRPVEDEATVTLQLGREPRGTWHTCARCRFGRPTVIETLPTLPDGSPFPTLYYLTCPWLVEFVGGLESACAVSEWASTLASDESLAIRMRAADIEYRSRRAAAAGGEDPIPNVGIAGQADPLATKCVHAHVAAYLTGIDDPVGEGALRGVPAECPDDLCARLPGDVDDR